MEAPGLTDKVLTTAVHTVIVSYRTPKLAAKCAESIMAGAGVPGFCRVVDTSGGPGALDATTLPAEVPVVHLPNVGYAKALNHGFRSKYPTVRAPLLLALNADTQLRHGDLAPMCALFEQDPELAVLGPRQVTPNGRIAHAGIPLEGATDGGRFFGEPDTGQGTERILPMEQVSGSIMLMRAQAVDSLGGIPEDTGLYFEDALLCHRLRKAGWKVGYTGLTTFEHHVAASPTAPGARLRWATEARHRYQEAIQS